MPIDMPMNGLRRNDDAMKTDAGIKKSCEHIAMSYEHLLPAKVFSPTYQIDFALISCNNNFTVCNDCGIIFFTPYKN
jgi:hypothetical protein